MLVYRDMHISIRADLAREIARPDLSEVDACGIGIVLILSACAKRGDTVLDARDTLRSLFANMERDLFRGWEQFRALR